MVFSLGQAKLNQTKLNEICQNPTQPQQQPNKSWFDQIMGWNPRNNRLRDT